LILDAPKKVKDVVAILEKDPTWLAHKYDEVNIEIFYSINQITLFFIFLLAT
jgi:hypothetical protein